MPHLFKVKIILACNILVLAFTTLLQAQPTKRIIQVKLSAAVRTMSFYYYDSAFNQIFLRFSNSSGQDTVVVNETYLSAGQILKYAMNLEGNGFRAKSFIMPLSDDTLKFEVDSDHNLHVKGGISFFIEDAIDILYADPRLYPQISNAFLDDITGLETVRGIYKSNTEAIQAGFSSSLSSKSEFDILSIIAKTDYYTRLLYWAQKNNRHPEIGLDMARLAEEKELIQSVSSSAIVEIFGKYIGNVIDREHLDTKDAIKIVNSVINLGWHKNITAEYFANILEDIPIETAIAAKCYDNLKKYLNGEYDEKLVRIARSILPTLVNTDKAMLATKDGKQLSFQSLLKSYPGKLLIIDFWASWCLPCRKEAPFFEAAKSDFLGKNIEFISISLDEDDKVIAWKKALEDDGFSSATNHYRLVKPTDNPVFKGFGVSTIPRYILINSKGEFINPNFYMPSDPKFTKELSRLLLID